MSASAAAVFPLRVSELEGLLASQRAREYRSELDVANRGGQLGAMQQKNRIMEEQVGTRDVRLGH